MRSDYSPTFWVARQNRLRNTDLNKGNCVKEISFNFWAENIVVYQGQIYKK